MARRPLDPSEPARVPKERLATVHELRADRFPLHRAGTVPDYCAHRRAAVDLRERRCSCTTCGAILDPYKLLDAIASDSDWVLSMRAEKSRLAEEIRVLHEKRSAAKSALKRTLVRGI